jgi:hypothetical protein
LQCPLLRVHIFKINFVIRDQFVMSIPSPNQCQNQQLLGWGWGILPINGILIC